MEQAAPSSEATTQVAAPPAKEPVMTRARQKAAKQLDELVAREEEEDPSPPTEGFRGLADDGGLLEKTMLSKPWKKPILKPLALVKPVTTRWSYLYFCFSRLVRLKEALLLYTNGEIPESDDTRDVKVGYEYVLIIG